ncbi:hypothetical protein J1614_007967 [Plenodomus biglobosus]|nr:hypothetical protein J1614_007967 [Plenodomus biglobosus]
MPGTPTTPSTMKKNTAYAHAPFAFEQLGNDHDVGGGGLGDLIPRLQAISSSPKRTVAFGPRGKSGQGMRGNLLSEDEGSGSLKSGNKIEAGDHALWKEGTELEKDAEQWIKGQCGVFAHQDVGTASTVSMRSFQRAEVVRVDRSYGGNDDGGVGAASSSGKPARLGEGEEVTDGGVPFLVLGLGVLLGSVEMDWLSHRGGRLVEQQRRRL